MRIQSSLADFGTLRLRCRFPVVSAH